MSDRLYLATRKGLFTAAREGTNSWSIVSSAFVGDSVTMLLDDARDGTLYAALNLGHFGVKLHRSEDRGKTWEECAAPAFANEPTEKDGKSDGSSVHQVWELTAGGTDQPGRLWAGTIPGGLFVSDDRGGSWSLVESLWNRPERESWFGGGYDDPGIHSICIHPEDHDHLTVGVSCGGVWVSRDGTATWEVRTQGMYATYMPPERREDPSIQDPHCLAHCPAHPEVLWVQHHNGMFRSTDGGLNWSELEAAPSNFGFAVVAHPDDPETAWFVPAVKDDCRVPVDGKLVVTRTRDGGKTFDVLRDGLPQEHAYDLVFRHALAIDRSGERLAFGSTTGSAWASENGGERWTTISSHLPPVYQVLFAN
ncbi:MAG: exo-alpha-sialidase [Acidobacteria bacterium]|nr:exo-alpha-sialidase [Acidobacteriota bacterium]